MSFAGFSVKFSLVLLALWTFSGELCAQSRIPHYCKTDVGVLGPYPNDGRVKVGDPCFGTDENGQRHDGVAVMSKSGDDERKEDDSGGGGKSSAKSGIPHYCKTDVGVLGPYPNDGRVKVGDPCFGTDENGQRHDGVAVMSKNGHDQ